MTNREKDMVARRKAMQTLQEIGAHYGISRERVRQILSKIDKENNLGLAKINLKYRTKPVRYVSRNCVICGKVMVIKESQIRKGNRHRTCNKWVNPDGTKMTEAQIQNFRYHNDPAYKERARKRMAEYISKNRETIYAKNNEYQKNHKQKMREIQARWYRKNKEKRLAIEKQKRIDNPEEYRVKDRAAYLRRKARADILQSSADKK